MTVPKMLFQYMYFLIVLPTAFAFFGMIFSIWFGETKYSRICKNKESIRLSTLFHISVIPFFIGYRANVCEVDGVQSIVYSWGAIEFDSTYRMTKISNRTWFV